MGWRTGLAALSMVCAAHAAPGKVNVEQAEKFRQDLRAAVEQGPRAISTIPLRRAHDARLAELERRSRRLFGDVFTPEFGSCVKATGALRSLWTDQISVGLNPSPERAAWLARTSFEAGVEYWACRIAVDALTPPVPPECLVVLDLSKPNAPAPPRPAHCPKF